MAERDQEFLEFVIKGLVDHPEEVKISRVVDEMGVLLTLDLNPEDMGKVIGRQGNTAKAIRTLLRVVGMKHNARVNLKINEPEGSTKEPRAPREHAPSLDSSGQVTKVQMSNSQSTSPTMKTVDEAMAELEL
jgi:predicted RNA-binding protein YlqC (UPF0109 family)